MIIETLTEIKAEVKQAETHAARVARYQSEGYPIVFASGVSGIPDGTAGIVPKNSQTNMPDYNAQITWLWDIPEDTDNGRFHIEKANDVSPVFSGTHTQDYVIKDMPEEYIEGYDGNSFDVDFKATDFEV